MKSSCIVIALIGLLTFAQSSWAEQKKTTIKKPRMSLRGSGTVARAQNTQADRERLTRIADEKELRRFIELGILVPLPNNLFVRVDSRLDERYRYCRPWTRNFLNDLGRAHLLTFGRPIQVNSAVRPISRQRALKRSNGNAAPVKGPTRSSHPTASTVDIQKGSDVNWMRDYLRQKKAAGQIAVAEEFRQSVFHVMVFQNYGKKRATKAPAARAKVISKPAPKGKVAVMKPKPKAPTKPLPKPSPRRRK